VVSDVAELSGAWGDEVLGVEVLGAGVVVGAVGDVVAPEADAKARPPTPSTGTMAAPAMNSLRFSSM
jgi:hypothetical protein